MDSSDDGARGMEDGFDARDVVDGLVVELIFAAAMAGAYWAAVERDPVLMAGFGKMAAKHGRRVRALAAEIGARARQGSAPDVAH